MHDYNRIIKETKAHFLQAALQYAQQCKGEMANVIEIFWDENFDRSKDELTPPERTFIDYCEEQHNSLRRKVVDAQATLVAALADLNGIGDVTGGSYGSE